MNFNIKKIIIIVIVIIIMISAILIFLLQSNNNTKPRAEITDNKEESVNKLKILHIMSYSSPWKWTDDQFAGFKDALSDLNIEYKVFQMDINSNSSPEAEEKQGRLARELISSWEPDLVYASDDHAQQYVTEYYIDSDLPFVFSGVNASPSDYGFNNVSNITGILEREHFIQTLKLVQSIVPDIKKIGIIIDDDSITWASVIKRIKVVFMDFPEIEFELWEPIITFDQYKEKIFDAYGNIDAIALLGIFTFKDQNNKNVPYTEVLKWTAENSRIPDFSFWKDRINYGTLCTVTVSGYEQGFSAGNLAKQILQDGKSPGDLLISSNLKGEPVINLKRARDLNILVPSEVLLTSEIVDGYEWEK